MVVVVVVVWGHYAGWKGSVPTAREADLSDVHMQESTRRVIPRPNHAPGLLRVRPTLRYRCMLAANVVIAGQSDWRGGGDNGGKLQ